MTVDRIKRKSKYGFSRKLDFFSVGRSPPACFSHPSFPFYAQESMEDVVLLHEACGRPGLGKLQQGTVIG